MQNSTLMVTLTFASTLQLLASLAGLAVAFGAIIHPHVRGWRLKAAFLLMFLSLLPIDLGFRAITEIHSDMLRHRIVFMFLSLCAAVWTISAYHEERIARRLSDQILLFMLVSFGTCFFSFVMPVLWFEKSEFAQFYLPDLLNNSALFLLVVAFLAHHVLIPSPRNSLNAQASVLNVWVFEMLAFFTLGFIFSLFVLSTGALAVAWPQMSTIAIMLFAFLTTVRIIYGVWQNTQIASGLERYEASSGATIAGAKRPLRLIRTEKPKEINRELKGSVENFPRI